MPTDSNIELRLCLKCNERKPLEEFTKRDGNHGIRRTCKRCKWEHAHDPRPTYLTPRRGQPMTVDANVPLDSKRCQRCKTVKLRVDFPRAVRTTDGLQGRCRECAAVRHALFYERNKARFSQIERPSEKRCSRCKRVKVSTDFTMSRSTVDGLDSCCSDCKIALNAARQRKATRSSLKAANMWAVHRLKFEQYQAILESQNYLCALCGNSMRMPAIDHDHQTGAIRGIICSWCNGMLGKIEQDGYVEKAFAYLARARAAGDLRKKFSLQSLLPFESATP